MPQQARLHKSLRGLVGGELYHHTADAIPTTVTPLSNEDSLTETISAYRGSGYLGYFTKAVKAAQATLARDLRDAGVEVPSDAAATHFAGVCGVRSHDETSCPHILSGDEIRRRFLDTEDTATGAGGVKWNRTLVACDPVQTRLRDDCMECFPRMSAVHGGEELVVRVHLFYPNSVPCSSVQDRRARLVTEKQFVPRDARTSQGYHVFHHARRGGFAAAAPDCESMFPYTPKGEESCGFTLEHRCTAVTVETVFVRDPARRQRPLYAEDTAQTRVHFSYLRATAFVTDDELVRHFPLQPADAAAMPAFSDDRDEEKYRVLVRLYLLAHDQGWTATLPHGCPHPLGSARAGMPMLFRYCATEVHVPDRRDASSPVLLQQRLQPDVESQIVRFCFRRVVSEALRRRVVAAAAASPELHTAVVCYLPFGRRPPALTDDQVAVLARLYPDLGIRRPATRRDWARLSGALYQHGVPLLDILAAVGHPLRDAGGAEISTDAYVPYTADMADDYFLVIANRPLRDYMCVMNQRWLCEHLLRPHHRMPISRAAFAAWVRYWDTMVQLKYELQERAAVDVVCAHLGLRLPAGTAGQPAACLVNGRVTDTSGGLVFPELGGQRFRDKSLAGVLPPGAPVLCKAWVEEGGVSLLLVSDPSAFVEALPSSTRPARKEGDDAAAAAAAAESDGVRSNRSRSPEGGDAEEQDTEAAQPSMFATARRTGFGSLGYGVSIRRAPVPVPACYDAGEAPAAEVSRSPSPEAATHGSGGWPAPAQRGRGRGRGRGSASWNGGRPHHHNNGDGEYASTAASRAPPYDQQQWRGGRGRGAAGRARGGGGRGRGAAECESRGFAARRGGQTAAPQRQSSPPKRSHYDVEGDMDGAVGGPGHSRSAGGGRDDCCYDPSYQAPSLLAMAGRRGDRR
ncbi:hypothetical protein NESM_000334800 [Novymonas esmeraldas]|uniref:Uncharacterized protein n=1 Tax=Novymonas esmeraldas TaxID=1808958 RepID=A0AAW0EJF1_9TRYP